jgi:hypothetical protein
MSARRLRVDRAALATVSVMACVVEDETVVQDDVQELVAALRPQPLWFRVRSR